jgi:hypothetical protein
MFISHDLKRSRFSARTLPPLLDFPTDQQRGPKQTLYNGETAAPKNEMGCFERTAGDRTFYER